MAVALGTWATAEGGNRASVSTSSIPMASCRFPTSRPAHGLYEANAMGNLFGLNVRDLDGGPGGYLAVSADGGGEHDGELAPVPEPASLMFFGTGLGFAARQLRKRRFHNS